ncbi:MAG: RNA-binding protein [Deltaproteobacteria bacterium]
MSDNVDQTERKCIVTGDVQPKNGLIRFAVSPEDVIFPDILNKLPGRGIWVSADADVLAEAIKKNLFSRAAKKPVKLPETLAADVDRLLAKHVVDLISLTRKSGRAICGFEKVKAMLDNGTARVLLQASDGSERGKQKLWTPSGGRWFGMLTAAELGLAFGRDSVIHGALAAGGLSKRVVEEAARLAGLRGIDGKGAVAKEKTTT